MASGIPWESLDYYSRMAAKHSVGVDLLPSSDCSTRIRRRTLERIKRTVFPIDGGASDDASCGARRRTGSLDCRLSPDKRPYRTSEVLVRHLSGATYQALACFRPRAVPLVPRKVRFTSNAD